MVYFSGTAFHGVMFLFCCFPVIFSHVLSSDQKQNKEVGVPSTLPISPLPTYPTQKFPPTLFMPPPHPLPQIKWPSLPYQIKMCSCGGFSTSHLQFSTNFSPGNIFLVLALIVELKSWCPIQACQLSQEKGGEGRWEASSGARRLGGSSEHRQGLHQRLPV